MAETEKMSAEDRIDRAKRNYGICRNHVTDWKKEALECIDFVNSHQWSEEDIAKLADEKRPAVVFNLVGPYVDAVVGTEIQNRESIRFTPREVGDSAPSEILDNVIKWVRDTADSEFEESNSFRDACITGVGATETRMSYDEDPDGIPMEDRCDSIEFAWPPTSTKRNLLDTPYLFRTRRISREVADELFPDFDGTWAENALGFKAGGEDEIRAYHESAADNYRDQKSDTQRGARDNVLLVEWQYFTREKYYRVAFQGSDKIVDIEPSMYDEIEAELTESGARITESYRRRYYRSYYNGDDEIEHKPLDAGHPGFTYKFVTGRYDRRTGGFYGLVRSMKDPQNWTNKFFSNILHIISSNAKGGAFFESGSFKNQSDAEKKWADPTGLIELNEGALANKRFVERAPAPYPAGMHSLMEFTIGTLPRVTGISPEFMGQAMVNQPGVLEQQRKQSGLSILAWLFDSMRAYRKDKGRLLLFYVQNYMVDGRLIRITGDPATNARYVPLVLDRDTAKYDIVLENAPTSPNQKERTFSMFMQMLPMLQKAGVPIVPEFFEYSPLPTRLTGAIRAAMSKKPDPVAEQMKQQQTMLMVRQALADIAKDETQAEYNAARAEATIADIDSKSVKAQAALVQAAGTVSKNNQNPVN